MKRGFAALSMVLIVSGVVMAIVMTMSLIAIGEGQSASVSELGGVDMYLVDGCAEDLLLKVHDNSAYATASITRPEGTCSITYNAGTSRPTAWDVTIGESGTTYGRRVQIVFTRSGQNLAITSWKEI
jgi:hypothetical protein